MFFGHPPLGRYVSGLAIRSALRYASVWLLRRHPLHSADAKRRVNNMLKRNSYYQKATPFVPDEDNNQSYLSRSISSSATLRPVNAAPFIYP